MAVTIQQLIEQFIDGRDEGITGTRSNPGNLKIVNGQLIHYQTPIAERIGERFLINLTRYSIQTGTVQKKLKEMLSLDRYDIIMRVPREYKGRLEDLKKRS